MRSVKPAETLHGRILFDAPTGDYQLRVVDDGRAGEPVLRHDPHARSNCTS